MPGTSCPTCGAVWCYCETDAKKREFTAEYLCTPVGIDQSVAPAQRDAYRPEPMTLERFEDIAAHVRALSERPRPLLIPIPSIEGFLGRFSWLRRALPWAAFRELARG